MPLCVVEGEIDNGTNGADFRNGTNGVDFSRVGTGRNPPCVQQPRAHTYVHKNTARARPSTHTYKVYTPPHPSPVYTHQMLTCRVRLAGTTVYAATSAHARAQKHSTRTPQ